MKVLTIGKLARLAGVGIETIRFYERIGLIEKPPRSEGGYRLYPEEAVSRLRFIRRAKELGFTLNEIRELLSLRLDGRSRCEDVRRQAEMKIAEIREKIRTLERMESALSRLVASCEAERPTNTCPILEAMEGEE